MKQKITYNPHTNQDELTEFLADVYCANSTVQRVIEILIKTDKLTYAQAEFRANSILLLCTLKRLSEIARAS